MSDVTTKRCDAPGCGRLKREANHWFRVQTYNTYFYCFSEGKAVELGAELITSSDVCGEDCAHKLLSEWFQQQQVAGGAGEEAVSAPSTAGNEPVSPACEEQPAVLPRPGDQDRATTAYQEIVAPEGVDPNVKRAEGEGRR